MKLHNQETKNHTDNILLSALQDETGLSITTHLEFAHLKKTINNYHRTILNNPISITARFLFFCILRRVTKSNSALIFFTSDTTFIEDTGLSPDILCSARKELIRLKLINYTPGDATLSIKSMYKLI